MKVSELRVGNLVINEAWGGEPCAIEVADLLGMMQWETTGKEAEFIKPIHLNKEMMESYGFEPNGVYQSMRLPTNKLTHEQNRIFIVVCFDGDAWIEIVAKRGPSIDARFVELQTNIIKVRYLHQLQNLYYALTGEELTLTEQNK